MMLYLAESGKHGTIYCVGSGEKRPLKDYITDIYNATECKARLGLGDIPYGDKQVMCLCIDKDCVLPGKKTEFSEGIKKTIQYLGA